jgi:hypothetical protein
VGDLFTGLEPRPEEACWNKAGMILILNPPLPHLRLVVK